MCFDKPTSTCNFNTSGNCCKGLLEDKLNMEQKKILGLMHLEICGACGKETLHVDVLGGEKKCMNCNGRFRNRRAE